MAKTLEFTDFLENPKITFHVLLQVPITERRHHLLVVTMNFITALMCIYIEKVNVEKESRSAF